MYMLKVALEGTSDVERVPLGFVRTHETVSRVETLSWVRVVLKHDPLAGCAGCDHVS